MQLDESTRQSWLVAGGTIQSFERVRKYFHYFLNKTYSKNFFTVWKWNFTGDTCKNYKDVDTGKTNDEINSNWSSGETCCPNIQTQSYVNGTKSH